jgi:hypothetical protein
VAVRLSERVIGMVRLVLLAVFVGAVAWLALRWRRERREDSLARLPSVFFVLRADRAAALTPPV